MRIKAPTHAMNSGDESHRPGQVRIVFLILLSVLTLLNLSYLAMQLINH